MKLINILLLSALPLLATAGTLTPFANALVWNASEANSANWAIILGNTQTKNFTSAFPKFNYSPGVKAGFNYSPDNNLFDTSFSWTYFGTSTTSTIPVGAGIVTSDFFSSSFYITHNLFAGAFLDWQLVMNMFDLDVSHKFDVTPTLSLRPQLGLKGGSIYQTMNMQWNALIFNATERATNNFTGIGPSFGLGARWNFYQNFNLVGDISTALMWGKWNNIDIYKRPAVLFLYPSPTTYSNSMTDAKLGTLMMDYYFGLDWAYRGKSQIDFLLGYEMQYWANQLRMPNIGLVPTHGDLTIQGVTCGLSIAL